MGNRAVIAEYGSIVARFDLVELRAQRAAARAARASRARNSSTSRASSSERRRCRRRASKRAARLQRRRGGGGCRPAARRRRRRPGPAHASTGDLPVDVLRAWSCCCSAGAPRTSARPSARARPTRSALFTTKRSAASISPAFIVWMASPDSGTSTTTVVSASRMMSSSVWPTPTVSTSTQS